jgi:hypothetical protein
MLNEINSMKYLKSVNSPCKQDDPDQIVLLEVHFSKHALSPKKVMKSRRPANLVLQISGIYKKKLLELFRCYVGCTETSDSFIQ